MAAYEKELLTILTSELFSKVYSSSNLKIAEFDALITLLIKAKIPFDTSYSPGTRRESEAAQLTVYINPNTTLNFTINFQGGESIFSST